VVPLKPEVGCDTAKAFLSLWSSTWRAPSPKGSSPSRAHQIARGVSSSTFLAQRESQSTAAAFSARARPGLPASMPITWEQLREVKSGAQWNISSAPNNLQRLKVDPWAGYWKAAQTLSPAIHALRQAAS